jgi:hypothetical protein
MRKRDLPAQPPLGEDQLPVDEGGLRHPRPDGKGGLREPGDSR